jgi:hypothetical protein
LKIKRRKEGWNKETKEEKKQTNVEGKEKQQHLL